jgi:ABC-type transport system involved in multi-copper enzyme maturation permease subunit
MTGSQTIYVFRWLIRDTFRQALASRVFWIMLAASGMFIVFCLGVSVDQGAIRDSETKEYLDPQLKPLSASNVKGHMTLLFGAFRFEEFRGAREQVEFLQVLLASYVAGGAGLVLTLLWTAGFLPEFLQPTSASVLLAKPVPRWALLLGKYFGVVAFVGFQALVFFGGTWAALGIKTNQWLYVYLAGIPLLTLHFAIIYSFSILIAVWARSTTACLFGSSVFWILCWGMNLGHHFMATQAPERASLATDLGYWLLPKPVDIVLLFENLLDAGKHRGTLGELIHLDQLTGFQPGLSLLASLLFSIVMLGISARELAQSDY